jgi:hypothetical protein
MQLLGINTSGDVDYNYQTKFRYVKIIWPFLLSAYR